MTATLLYLVLLPLSVWLLGAVFGLLDGGDQIATLRRIAWRLLPFGALAVAFGVDAAEPMAAALATVLVLQTATSMGLKLAVRRGWLSRDPEN